MNFQTFKLKAVFVTAAGLFGFAATPLPAAAAPMTCEAFRSALSRAISNGGDRVAQPTLDHLAFARPDGTMKRYEMSGIVGLEGNLRCAKNDKLEAFGASANVTARNGEQRLNRLADLGSATICAVAPTRKPAACIRMVDKLASAVTDGFTRAVVRGEEEPSDFKKKSIGEGYEIEFDARESALGFNLVAPSKNAARKAGSRPVAR